MKKKLVELELLEKDDRVLLPSGEAIVMEDEEVNHTVDTRFWGTIKVKWIDHCREEMNGILGSVERKYCSLIKD